MQTRTLLPMLHLGKSALREASEASTLSGSDEHVIQGEEGIICSFIWLIPLDVFCSTAAAVSPEEMKVFTELGRPFATAPGCTITAGMTISKHSHGSDFCETEQSEAL